MNTGNYKTLERDEVVSLTYNVRNEIRRLFFVGDVRKMDASLPKRPVRIWTGKNQSEKAEELEAIINEVGEEVFRRFDMGLRFYPIINERESNLDSDDDYYISFVAREDKLLIDCCVIYGQVHSFELQRKDGRKEIPDEQLLHEKPHEWLAEYLNEYEEVSSSSFGVR